MENTTLLGILIALVLIVGAVNIYYTATISKPDMSNLATKEELTGINNAVSNLASNSVSKDELANLATKEDLSSITVAIPAATPQESVDKGIVDKVNKLCELSNGCERYDMSDHKADILVTEIGKNSYRPLKKAISDVTGLEWDEYALFEVIVKDQIAYAADQDSAHDGNYNAELFLRVKYNDGDSSDDQVIYLQVIGAVEDNVDAEITSVSEVTRTFELE
jgi:hypothetical protein